MASAAAGVGLRLLVIADQLRLIDGLVSGIAIGNLRYPRWGFGTLVVVCGAVTIVLLVLSQQRTEVAEEV
jgi:hypothetical protein